MSIARNAMLAARVKELEAALRAARDELTKWGWGDFHYGPTYSQEQSVVDAIAAIDKALGGS